MNLLNLAIRPVVGCAALLFTFTAQAQISDFTQNPTTNSVDFTTKITSLGGSVTTLDFESHPVGALQGNFYTTSNGVTLTANGDVDLVENGAGPGQSNTSSPPLSVGEGPHAASNYLYDGPNVSSLTISFNAPVWGAGLFTIDHFNPGDTNPLTIEAFDGPDGTGNSLGVVTSAPFNYQPNNLYFMGITSDAGDIRSIVFTDVNTQTGDTMGLDDILYAPAAPAPAPPAPSAPPEPVPTMSVYGLLLMIIGLGFIGQRRLRVRRDHH